MRIADASDADTLSQSDYDDIEPFHLRLTYYLKDGSQLSRSYSLYLRRSDLTVPSSVTARVNALYMCRESVLRRVLSYGYAHLATRRASSTATATITMRTPTQRTMLSPPRRPNRFTPR